VLRPETSVTGRLLPAPEAVAATPPLPAAPPQSLTGEREIGAEQDPNG
jgi:hypothetical protein